MMLIYDSEVRANILFFFFVSHFVYVHTISFYFFKQFNSLEMEKRVFKTVSFILLSFFVLCHVAYAQDQIEVKGIVTDNATQEPLAGVSVILEASNQSVTTGAEGQFSISA